MDYYEMMLELEQSRLERLEQSRWEEEWCEEVVAEQSPPHPTFDRVVLEIAEEDCPF